MYGWHDGPKTNYMVNFKLGRAIALYFKQSHDHQNKIVKILEYVKSFQRSHSNDFKIVDADGYRDIAPEHFSKWLGFKIARNNCGNNIHAE